MSTVSSVPAAVPVPAELPVRVAARAIDAAVLVAATVGVGVAFMGFGWDWLVVNALSVLLYFVLLDTFAGATIGKAALGLRVLGPDGGRPTFRQALVREAFTLLGAIPFVGGLLALAAWVTIALSVRKSPTRQGRHDVMAGGTRVVRAR